jgi:hypothetical protein
LSFAVLLYRFYLLGIGPPVVTRNSANSVELLIFVTNHGSGPRLVDTCSWMTRSIGVGPKAIESTSPNKFDLAFFSRVEIASVFKVGN